MVLKIQVFKELDRLAPPNAILATNTSTMSPTEIAAQTGRPDRCIALHFFNPVPKMKLIEVICGLETSEDIKAEHQRKGAAGIGISGFDRPSGPIPLPIERRTAAKGGPCAGPREKPQGAALG